MKKPTTTRKKASAKPLSDVHVMAQDVIKYLETHAKKIDKATLAKYIAVAVLIIYGIRKSNVLGSIAISLITGVASKFMADRMEGQDIAEVIPSEAKS